MTLELARGPVSQPMDHRHHVETWKTPRWKGRIEMGNTNGALERPMQAGGPACGQQKNRISASAVASHGGLLRRGDGMGRR